MAGRHGMAFGLGAAAARVSMTECVQRTMGVGDGGLAFPADKVVLV